MEYEIWLSQGKQGQDDLSKGHDQIHDHEESIQKIANGLFLNTNSYHIGD